MTDTGCTCSQLVSKPLLDVVSTAEVAELGKS